MALKCDEYKKWVEEEIEEPIQTRKEGARQKCEQRSCKKWCLCCNKWFCWIETFFYWVIEWIVRIILKWIISVSCRILDWIGGFFFNLGLLGLSILGWPIRWGWCILWGRGDLDKLPKKTLQVEAVIVDSSKAKNIATDSWVTNRIVDADRILFEEARVHVKLSGGVKRLESDALYRLDATGLGAKISEYLKGIFTTIGRRSWRHLTLYVVGSIAGTGGGLHLPIYGSVFVSPNSRDTTACHEFGHALLTLWNAHHTDELKRLMNTPADEREHACGWPTGVPTLSRDERCTIRRSRWLDWSWVPFLP